MTSLAAFLLFLGGGLVGFVAGLKMAEILDDDHLP